MRLTRLGVATPAVGSRQASSEQADRFGFRPAFKNIETGTVHLSCHSDGMPASVHVLDGLPDDWVLRRDSAGHVVEAKCSVVAGFVRDARFYTREQATRLITLLGQTRVGES
jgi:hypothetical protein